MFSVEHASSTGPAVMEQGRRGQQASCLVAKQAVEFPQVRASKHMRICILICENQHQYAKNRKKYAK